MKVLFVGEDLVKSRSGVVTVMNQILHDENLKGKVQFTTIFTTSDDHSTALKLWGWAKAYLKFFYYLPGCKIVHIHHASNLNFWLSGMMVVFTRLFGKKALMHNHAADFKEFYNGCSPVKQRWVCKILTLANCNIVLSKQWLAWYTSIAPDAVWVMLQNAIEVPVSVAEKSITTDNVLLIYLARIEQRKGFFDTIKAMPAIVKKFPGIKLYVAGQGDVAMAKALVTKKGLENNVTILGHINSIKRDEILSAGHILVFPSYNEGLPMSLLEAMSYGVVPIATPVGGIPDVVISGENGILISPGDVDALVTSITSSIEAPMLYQNMSKNAISVIASNFNYSNYGEKLMSIYDILLNIN